MTERGAADRGRRDDRGFGGEARESRSRESQPLRGVRQRLLELMADRDLLFGLKARPRHQALDEVPVAEVGRHAAGGGVRVRQQTELLERGELVPHRRRREVEAVFADERRRGHRLGGGDVLADDGAQQIALPVAELWELVALSRH